MPHLCPKPCGRLTTAAVFISVSVVQFVAGLILLKSRYLYLLSGPDFWTAASNLAVGVLLGISAAVWKDVQKTAFKHIVRRNLLASLVASAIAINSTTAIILILGEGNALLSIQLEDNGKYSSTSEILAYSYATSVCSPIVSVVVAIVFLSGMWFRVSDKEQKMPEIKSIIKRDSVDDYNWVFKGRSSPIKQFTKTVLKDLSFKSLSSSSEDESFNLTDENVWSVTSINHSKRSSQKENDRTLMTHHSKFGQKLACKSEKLFKNTPENFLHETRRVSFADDNKTVKFLRYSPYACRRQLVNDYPFYPDPVESESINEYETNRVSFTDDAKTIKLLKYSPYAYRRQLTNDYPFYPDSTVAEDKNSTMSFEEFKKVHSRKMSKQLHKKRKMLLMGYPAFQQLKHLEDNVVVQNFQKCDSPKVYIPRAQARRIGNSKFSLSSDMKAEEEMDLKRQNTIVNENCSALSDNPCEGDIPFSDVLTEIIRNKNSKFQRTSTSMNLKKSNLSPSNDGSVDRKVFRTSTTGGSSSANVPELDISDIEIDSVIDENEIYELEDKNDYSELNSLPPAICHEDSNIEADDSFSDMPQSSMLAGKVVKIQINSLPRTLFHSKLVPVSVPLVSSVKKKSLQKKPKDIVENDKFLGKAEQRFSSFHGNFEDMGQRNDHNNINGENPVEQKSETLNDSIICDMSPENNLVSSPAQTSVYDSAFFEYTHLSNLEYSKPIVYSSVSNSPYYTPKNVENFSSLRNLDIVQ